MTAQLDHVDLRRTGSRVSFVRVLTDGTEEPQEMGTVIREDSDTMIIERPSGICITVKPWRDGTVHSWFESRSRDDAESQWGARTEGWRGR